MECKNYSYEIMEPISPEEETYGIRMFAWGVATYEIPDLSGNKKNVENLVRLYNENHLLPEEFARTTELLLGVLL